MLVKNMAELVQQHRLALFAIQLFAEEIRIDQHFPVLSIRVKQNACRGKLMTVVDSETLQDCTHKLVGLGAALIDHRSEALTLNLDRDKLFIQEILLQFSSKP